MTSAASAGDEGRNTKAAPWDGRWKRARKDVVWLALLDERADQARDWLTSRGWEPAPGLPD